ncbi:phosphatidylglycerophosphatase A [Haliea sp. E17]|uniref:phosphatidylglycerophosphatase A family protein n=1 Tax=Haliea sp. E17 TaxID=3401576 RepID=UPI003AAF2D2B
MTRQPTPFTSPVQFLAFGFGSGLSPKAPGTAGTVAALPLYWLLAKLGLPGYTVAVLVALLAGVWICQRASDELGVHDHGGIVWDEFVGLWIALWGLPVAWPWVLAGFVLFRLFDIVKPWPIGYLDRRVHGGLGIMLDDVVAGVFAGICLHAAHWWLL